MSVKTGRLLLGSWAGFVALILFVPFYYLPPIDIDIYEMKIPLLKYVPLVYLFFL